MLYFRIIKSFKNINIKKLINQIYSNLNLNEEESIKNKITKILYSAINLMNQGLEILNDNIILKDIK